MIATTERLVERADAGECPECGGATETARGEAVCVDCGLVVDDARLTLDTGRYKRRGDLAAPRTPTRHDRGLGGCYIGWKDGNGERVDSAQLRRMRREQRRAQFPSKQARGLVYTLTELRRIAGALDLGDDVLAQASTLVETAQDAGLFPGRSLEGMAAAAAYATLRANRRPHRPEDVAEPARCDVDELTICYRALNRQLNLPTPPPRAAEAVPRLASELDVPAPVEARALELARFVDERAVCSGRRPSGIAATAIYMAADERSSGWSPLSQERVAEAAGCCATTIRATRDAIQEASRAD